MKCLRMLSGKWQLIFNFLEIGILVIYLNLKDSIVETKLKSVYKHLITQMAPLNFNFMFIILLIASRLSCGRDPFQRYFSLIK